MDYIALMLVLKGKLAQKGTCFSVLFICVTLVLLAHNECLKSSCTPLLAGNLNLDFDDMLPDGVPMHPLAKHMREQCWRAPALLVEPSDVCTTSCNFVSSFEAGNSLCATWGTVFIMYVRF